MKFSHLQLTRYLVPEISVSANSAFNPGKSVEVDAEQLTVHSVVAPLKDQKGSKDHSWLMEMSVTQCLKEKQNFPYTFKVSLVGVFLCKDGLPPSLEEERFVRTNGSSVLYGAAREILRSITTLGPWGEVLLPSVSFVEDEVSKQEQPIQQRGK